MTTRSAPTPPGPVPAPTHVERYGPDALHLVDLFAPAEATAGSAARGLVVLLHGGFWRNRWDRTHLYPLASALAASGFAVALPEYRRVGDPGGGWPGTGDDVLRILSTVPTLAREHFGAVATSRVTLVGHSAGGHLAVWSQTSETQDAAATPPIARSTSGAATSLRVDRVVSLAGVLDLAAAHELGLSDDAAGELLGGDVKATDFAGRLAAIDPQRLAVPATEVVLVHGALDDEVPVSFSVAYAARDPRIRFSRLPEAGHYELIDPSSAAWVAVLDAVGGAA